MFADPISGNIAWRDIEGLPIAAGARLIEGRGSRLRFKADDEVGTFHRPHPAMEARRYRAGAAGEFLERMETMP